VADKTGLDAIRIEGILAKHQVSTSSSKPLPARLQFNCLKFSGTKVLTGVNREGVKVAQDAVERVPYTFEWNLALGLNGVGSDLNLRGKSSVLKVLMWALRGRCDLKTEVRSWIDRVEVDFTVDSVAYRVEFDVDHENGGAPNGSLRRTTGVVSTVVGSFMGEEQFEEVMGAAMMTALRLPLIAAAQEGRRTQHAWPTYAGALLVRGDTLNYLLGEHSWAGLPSRLLSLFVGAEWAAARAEATTAATVAQTDLRKLEEAAAQHASALSDAHTKALAEVEAARANLEKFPASRVDMQTVTNALTRVSELDRSTAEFNRLLLGARSTLAMASAQYEQEETRRHREIEDAIAVKFFQQLRPTVCPRCAAPVTKERRAAEDHGDSCSVCTTGLAIDAVQENLVLAQTVPAAERARLERDAQERGADDRDDDEDSVDDLQALASAITAAQGRVDRLDRQLQEIQSERAGLAEVVAATSGAQRTAQRRQEAELTVARAEGAAAALAPDEGSVGPDQETIAEIRAELTVLNAAKEIASTWVQNGQRQWLAELGDDITNMARDFGISNLTGITLGGGATMKVTQGGATSNYGDCERGEKLRLKLATAIALIKQGRVIGVGRHPGLLFVDSPGSEEVTDDDFDTMLEALHREAAEADIQVFVATRHTDELVDLLGEDRCRLGRGTNFVW
jgi:chorismate mutase